ncbi:MAG: hypothetical protein JSW07_17375, partial [bacterium]
VTDNLILAQEKRAPGLPHSKGDKGDRQRRAVWTITTAGAFATYGDKTTLFDEYGHQIDPGRYGRPYISGDLRGSTEIGTRYLAVLSRFMKEVVTIQQFQTMLPHHELIVKTQLVDDDQTVWQYNKWYNYPEPPDPPYPMAFCLADVGKAYLIYLPYGGWVDLKLVEYNAGYEFIWLDPRSGKRFEADSELITAEDIVHFQPPHIHIEEYDPGDWILFIKKL